VTGAGTTRSKEELADELKNFEEITVAINPTPDKIPQLKGVDIHGEMMPLKSAIGGDHILYVDFNRRYDLDARIAEAEAQERTAVADKLRLNKRRAGILVADIAGHRVTDAVIAAMLHQCFLLGALYELDMFGEITTRLFEQLNTRFFKTASVNKYFTMIYGEISEEGRFRFISAAHQPPVVFSREYQKIMPIRRDMIVTFPPVGMLPSVDDRDPGKDNVLGYKKRYTVNELHLLGPGDLMLLCTDGLADHDEGRFLAGELEGCLRETASAPSKMICAALRERIGRWGPPTDDISFVVIKKN